MSRNKLKITVIGGGSYSWAFGFARQFVKSEHLTGVRLTLMDVNAEALDLVHRAVELYNRTESSPVEVVKTTELEPALDGADFVLVSISTGGLAAMRHDLEIPEKYGIWHTVGDTVGPGGWLRAVRNIPVFQDLGARMKRLCPDAWLVNVTNPLTVLTRVPERNFGIKTIGMCPGVEQHARTLARIARLDPKRGVEYVVTGIDHGSWFTELSVGGVDVLERLKALGYHRSDDKLPEPEKTNDPHMGPVRNRAILAVWREIGWMPSLNDRHAVENWPWFLANDDGKLEYSLKRTRIEERQSGYEEKRERLVRYVETEDLEALGGLGHGDDPILEVIESLCGHRSFLWGSNYKNIGQIPGFPEGSVVETRCRFDAAGVHPLCSPMPDVLKAIVLPQVYRQEAIIDIALHGTFDELSALVLTDPMCSRLRMGQCRQMVREMLNANREHVEKLPCFRE